jgi:hypothetical protein
MKLQSQPFYLKIWLSDPQFINSQIVTSFRDNLHFYDNTFRKSDEIKEFPIDKFRLPELALFEWELFIDENYYFEVRYSDGTVDNCYSIKKGDIWLGKLKGES